MQHLVLVDGNSLLFRAYHATANNGTKLLQNKKGVYTNALLSFIKMFEKILQETQEYILVAFDTHHPTKRHQIYSDYKKGRPATPSELISQIPLIKQYLTLIGVKHYFQDEYEADDIIGTLAKKASDNKIKVSIYSSDQDLLQLVDANISVYLIKKGLKVIKNYCPQTLLEEYGLKENQMIDYKALVGDPSDNIKGVAGIGPKTAQRLLQTYDSLDNLLNCLEEIKPSLKTKINDSMVNLELSKILTTIDTKIPLPFELYQTKMQECSYYQIQTFYEEMDFRRLKITKYVNFKSENSSLENSKNNNNQELKDPFAYQIINQNESLNKIIKEIKPDQTWTCYFEFDANSINMLGIGFSDGTKKYNFFLEANIAFNNHLFINYLKNPLFHKNVFNAYQIQLFFKKKGKIIDGINFDLLAATYLLFPLESFKIEYIFAKIDLLNQTNFANQLSQNDNLEKSLSLKAFLLANIKEHVQNHLNLEKQLFLFYEIELPLTSVLAQLEHQEKQQENVHSQKISQIKNLEVFLSPKYYLVNTIFNNNIYILSNFPVITLKTLAILGNIIKIKNFFKFLNDTTQDQEKLAFFGIVPKVKNSKEMIEKNNETHHLSYNIVNNIAQELKISPINATIFVDQYLNVDSQILDYLNKLLQQIKEKQYLETFLKRKVFLPSLLLLEKKDHRLSFLFFFLQENILDLQKITLLQLFRHLNKSDNTNKITYSFLNHCLQNDIDLMAKYCNPFLNIFVNKKTQIEKS
ncbi:5'-3' exonuclease H3TH domain-containing protein [Candidatus Phytoplasma solani]|uniref:5'-3' exonuclease H3TH domain-containing protein n=1 Tax=Candidatus Phytoplasma solani TaxID=69896 RepID=UPI0032DBABF4